MANGEINATDLTEETIYTLSGNEQFVMFDPVEGKRADIDEVAKYIAGDESQLQTSEKSSVVGAINEVNGKATDLKEDIDELASSFISKYTPTIYAGQYFDCVISDVKKGDIVYVRSNYSLLFAVRCGQDSSGYIVRSMSADDWIADANYDSIFLRARTDPASGVSLGDTFYYVRTTINSIDNTINDDLKDGDKLRVILPQRSTSSLLAATITGLTDGDVISLHSAFQGKFRVAKDNATWLRDYSQDDYTISGGVTSVDLGIKRTDEADISTQYMRSTYLTVDSRSAAKKLIEATFPPKYYDIPEVIPSTMSGMYALFDALVTEGFCTRTTLGTVASTYPVYEYHFKWRYDWLMSDATTISTTDFYNLPKIGIVSGIHGDEESSVMFVYKFIYNLFHNDEFAKYRRGLDIRVVPLCNPYGYDNNQRTTYSGEDLNRDFDDFTTTEAQILKAWLDSTPFDLFCDLHNSDGGKSDADPNTSAFLSLPKPVTNLHRDILSTAYSVAVSQVENITKKMFGTSAQTSFVWEGTTNATMRNYIESSCPDIDIVTSFEFSRYCYAQGHSDVMYNASSTINGLSIYTKFMEYMINKALYPNIGN